MKRICCLILCAALLLPMLFLRTNATEPEFYKVRINAGNGAITERAILDDGELYIPAVNFARYTRYRFDSHTNTFLIDGQEADKAFKKVMINPDTKKLAVGTQIIDLTDCFTVNGRVYLPLCQMLPILNAEIIAAGEGEIFVANNDLSLAELLYDFDIHDYYYDLSKEFYDNEGLLAAYVIPSYLFNSVTNFRFDRLDFFFDSGTFEDYLTILSSYLKDDSLFREAFSEIDDPRTILNVTTGIHDETEKLNDLVDWYRELEDLELDDNSPLNQDALIKLIQSGEKFPRYQDDIIAVLGAAHEEIGGVSFAKVVELIDYIYTCCTHVEDNHKMLDAVYAISSGGNYKDPQFRAAKEVYDLYGEHVVLALTEQIGKERLTELIKETAAGKKLAIYELTAQVSGAVWELIIPGDTEDISNLTLHAGVANTALMRASAGNLNTEQAVENYRLSLLLMMIASRKCYSIMADTAEGYHENAADYRAKIEKLENMIKGLYLVAGNIRFEAYENFASLGEQNRALLKDANLFDTLQPIVPGESILVDESVYLEFLAQNPVYHYYALLDIDQDGCMELVAMEQMMPEGHSVDLWIYTGQGFRLGWEDIWSASGDLTYSEENFWLESETRDSVVTGMFFYSLDANGTVHETSFSDSSYSGKWYNGLPVEDEAALSRWNALAECYRPETSVPIDFLPVPFAETPPEDSEEDVPQDVPVQQPQQEAYLSFLKKNLYVDFIDNDSIRDACREQYIDNYYTFHDLNSDGVEDLILWLGYTGADGEIMTFTIRENTLCYTGSAPCDGTGTHVYVSDHDHDIILACYDGGGVYAESYRFVDGMLTLIARDTGIPHRWYGLDPAGSLPMEDSDPIPVPEVSVPEPTPEGGLDDGSLFAYFLRVDGYAGFLANQQLLDQFWEDSTEVCYWLDDVENDGTDELIVWVGVPGMADEVLVFAENGSDVTFFGSIPFSTGYRVGICGASSHNGFLIVSNDGMLEHITRCEILDGVLTVTENYMIMEDGWYALDANPV